MAKLGWMGWVIVIVGLAGCSHSGSSATTQEYQTIGKDPSRDTDRAQADNARALKLIDDNKLDEAETLLKGALNADVTYGPAHNSLGMVYYAQQKFYLAAWEFDFAAKLMPAKAEPLNNQGLVFEAVGKLPEAIKAYEEAVKLEENNPQYLGNLARAKIRHGEKGQDVRQLLQKLIERDNRPDWVNWAKETLVRLPKEEAK